ncbi:MAG: hypothetical protein R2874_15000 [Desulfobacterales bacterium]
MMRQKYLIIRDSNQKVLKIREYAVVDKNLKNVATAHLRADDFSLIYEETYANDAIESAIAADEDLILTLRTENFFPAFHYAAELAEAVTALYDAQIEDRKELFFDDMGLN